MAVSVPHLPGREHELAALLDLVDAADELTAAAVVVGEAGIGKTALWLAAAEAAEERGYLVLSCRPSEAEARFSFVGLVDLIGAVVPDVLPELRGHSGGRSKLHSRSRNPTVHPPTRAWSHSPS